MEIITKDQSRFLQPTPSLKLYEYDMHETEIGVGVAEINGRYPENGFASNSSTKELAYISEGQGKLITPNQEVPLSKGDAILLHENDLYAWEGHMKLVISNAPRFDPAQHKVSQ